MFSASQSKCLLKLQATFVKAVAQQKQYKLNFWHNKASLKVKERIPTSTAKEHSFSALCDIFAYSYLKLKPCNWYLTYLNPTPCLKPDETGLSSVVAVDYVRLFKCSISEGSIVSRGGGALGLIFAGYLPLASQSPYPIIVYSVANYKPPS